MACIDLLNKLQNEFPHLKFSPFISSQAIIQSGEAMSGGMIFGVIPQKEAQINPIYKEALGDLTLDKFDVITGSGISDKLFLTSGAKATLYFTELNPTGFSMMPKMKRFNFANSFAVPFIIAIDKIKTITPIETPINAKIALIEINGFFLSNLRYFFTIKFTSFLFKLSSCG